MPLHTSAILELLTPTKKLPRPPPLILVHQLYPLHEPTKIDQEIEEEIRDAKLRKLEIAGEEVVVEVNQLEKYRERGMEMKLKDAYGKEHSRMYRTKRL